MCYWLTVYPLNLRQCPEMISLPIAILQLQTLVHIRYIHSRRTSRDIAYLITSKRKVSNNNFKFFMSHQENMLWHTSSAIIFHHYILIKGREKREVNVLPDRHDTQELLEHFELQTVQFILEAFFKYVFKTMLNVDIIDTALICPVVFYLLLPGKIISHNKLIKTHRKKSCIKTNALSSILNSQKKLHRKLFDVTFSR
uniref:Uncharacterized protein n=2 Tax=Cacopsylla melanoneura TaxID=428564 RepID=A0A8D8RU43_9HEMI